jgi:threonine/homoserine/homoserine lactone efflux protein
MYPYAAMFGLAFLIGLSGALVPGPTLVVTIRTSLHGGWMTGPKITAGHVLLEIGIFILVLAGVSSAPDTWSAPIAAIGGIALIVFGAFTIIESRKLLKGKFTEEESAVNPFFAGFLTSAANPFFWIWWLTVGSAMLVAGLQGGVLLAATFLAGHAAADLTWYTAVSTAIHRGRTILSERGYRITLGLCGVFLVGFGIYYLFTILGM